MAHLLVCIWPAVFAACADQAEPLKKSPVVSPWCQWAEHPGNPLIDPAIGQPILGDPTFLPPSQTPDGRWHLFANSLDGIYHFTSNDGIKWTEKQRSLFGNLHMRANLYVEGDTYFLLYEKFRDPLHSQIELRSSLDLFSWSEPVTLLEPSLPWESSTQSTTGNPFVLKRDGQYWLYYSADSVFLHDSIYFEPRYIGLAYADSLTGPYVKRSEPILGPSKDDRYRNQGAGSMKLFDEKYGGRWLALNNGIYTDNSGASHSAIMLMTSADGIRWEAACPNPILAPESGWKQAYVYAFDMRRVGNKIWLYFNARDGWFEGKERIGLATLDIPTTPP